MIKLQKIIIKALICALLAWSILLSPIYFVGCWVFVAFSAFFEIISFDFRFTLTSGWMKEMQTFKEYVRDVKEALEEIWKNIKDIVIGEEKI